MKLLTLCLILAAVCLAFTSVGVTQKDAERGKAPSGPLPDEVCKAIEQYIATIDAARGLRDKVERKGRYTAAQQALDNVLTRYGQSSLSADITAYADQSELTIITDPTDAAFDKQVAQRLNTRSRLLDWCSSYTMKR